MKQIAIVAIAVLALGCVSRPAEQTTTSANPSVAGSGEVGAATARQAVERFLDAMRRQDIQATALIWGTEKGAARDQMERRELEMRVLIMQCYLAHDTHTILSDAPGTSGKRSFDVSLVNRNRERRTPVLVVQGPRDRWYVENVELDPVKEFCRNPPRG